MSSIPHPRPRRLLVRRVGRLVTMDASRRILRDAWLLAEDGVVRSLGEGRPAHAAGAEVLDARGGIVTPGLINTHHHMFQNLARAFAPIANLPLLPWLAGHMPLWRRFTPEALFVATQVACVELMLSGCTLTSDHHYLFPRDGGAEMLDAGFAAAAALGLRYVGCRGSVNVPSDIMPAWSCQDLDTILADCQRLHGRFHQSGPDAMAQLAVAPCTVFGCSADHYRESARLARHLRIRLHTHCGETIAENDEARRSLGARPLPYMAGLGWEGDDVWLAHGIHFSDAEVRRLNRTRTGVAHCPVSNMRLGSGVCRVSDLRRGGSPVSLGVDGSASNDSGHLLAEARAALLLTRVTHGAGAITPEQVLEMATLEGARNLGRAGDLGSLEPGKQADFAVFPGEDLFSNGAHEPVHALVLCHPRQVDALVVKGEVRVRGGQPVGVDLPRLLERHRRLARRLHEGKTA
ncbi:MAG: amidohydrolase family protein [Limisphaerales bacterium]